MKVRQGGACRLGNAQNVFCLRAPPILDPFCICKCKSTLESLLEKRIIEAQNTVRRRSQRLACTRQRHSGKLLLVRDGSSYCKSVASRPAQLRGHGSQSPKVRYFKRITMATTMRMSLAKMIILVLPPSPLPPLVPKIMRDQKQKHPAT